LRNTTNHRRTPAPGRSTLLRYLPGAWLVLSATWAAVIVVTDLVAWPLALWIATTVGPLTALERRHRRSTATSGAPT
jgi:hypothetical protein